LPTVWESGVQLEVAPGKPKLWVVSKVLEKRSENKTSFRLQNEDDEDDGFNDTCDETSKAKEVVFIAFEEGSAKRPDIAKVAYKLSLLNFF
jgi:hypothetical protein